MKRIMLFVLCMLLSFSLAYSQTSYSQAVNFSVKDAPVTWPISYTEPFVQWYNVGDSILQGIDVDLDSLTRVTGNFETEWIVKLIAYDSTTYCFGDTANVNGNQLGTATLEFSQIIGTTSLPKRKLYIGLPKQFKYTNAKLLPGVTLRFPPAREIKIGSSFHLSFVTHDLLFARENAQAMYSKPPRPDSLRILGRDTMGIGDTTYTTALPARFGYVSVFLKDGAINNDSLFRAQIGYQVKFIGGDWAGRLDTLGGPNWFMLIDSTAIDSGQTKAFTCPTTLADSLRLVLRAKNSLGRQFLDYIKVLLRD
jgi:hypothetical protein